MPFFNELDILEIHLATLWDFVDLFVVTEARQTFNGSEKPLYLSSNSALLERFGSKLDIQVLDGDWGSLKGFEAEWLQRDLQHERLRSLMQDGDLLIFSDVDEIVRPQALLLAKSVLESRPEVKIAHFAQDLTYFFLNNLEISGKLLSYTGEYPNITQKKWLGSVLARWEDAKSISLTELRWPEHKAHGVRIEQGGWHFSWVGGPSRMDAMDRVILKLDNTAHVEFNNPWNKFNLERRIDSGKDLVRRRGGRFSLVKDPSFLPEYVTSNIDKFSYLLRVRTPTG
jgi:beta-1,4-mannosyl-glycoprotein beta-1,4-N-acetylglucosaminyltransferase